MKDMVYLNGKFIERSNAQISIEDRGFQFGDGIYEVIKLYQGRPFKLREHIIRLLHSAEKIKLDIGYSIDEIIDIINKLLEVNKAWENYREGNIYVQVTRGAAPRSHSYSPDLKPTFISYLLPAKNLSSKIREEGVEVITMPDRRWYYCNIKTTNLLPNIMAKQEAKEEGAYEGVFVTENEKITEATSSNIFIVKDEVIYTHPANEDILNGITREVVLEIARENFEVEEREFYLDELYEADEVFLTSTTKEVLAVIKVDNREISDGNIGEITGRLYDLYQEYKKDFDKF